MNCRVLAALTTLVTLSLMLPVQAQRFGNSSLEFYDQGVYRLEQEVQRLQKLEATSQPSPLMVLPPNTPQGNPQPSSQPTPLPPETTPKLSVPSDQSSPAAAPNSAS